MATKKVALEQISCSCYVVTMSPEQCRAARAWLDWKQDRLATEANVGLSTVKGYEGGKSKTIPATLAAMKAALERAGIEFVENDGKALGIAYRLPA